MYPEVKSDPEETAPNCDDDRPDERDIGDNSSIPQVHLLDEVVDSVVTSNQTASSTESPPTRTGTNECGAGEETTNNEKHVAPPVVTLPHLRSALEDVAINMINGCGTPLENIAFTILNSIHSETHVETVPENSISEYFSLECTKSQTASTTVDSQNSQIACPLEEDNHESDGRITLRVVSSALEFAALSELTRLLSLAVSNGLLAQEQRSNAVSITLKILQNSRTTSIAQIVPPQTTAKLEAIGIRSSGAESTFPHTLELSYNLKCAGFQNTKTFPFLTPESVGLRQFGRRTCNDQLQESLLRTASDVTISSNDSTQIGRNTRAAGRMANETESLSQCQSITAVSGKKSIPTNSVFDLAEEQLISKQLKNATESIITMNMISKGPFKDNQYYTWPESDEGRCRFKSRKKKYRQCVTRSKTSKRLLMDAYGGIVRNELLDPSPVSYRKYKKRKSQVDISDPDSGEVKAKFNKIVDTFEDSQDENDITKSCHSDALENQTVCCSNRNNYNTECKVEPQQGSREGNTNEQKKPCNETDSNCSASKTEEQIIHEENKSSDNDNSKVVLVLAAGRKLEQLESFSDSCTELTRLARERRMSDDLASNVARQFAERYAANKRSAKEKELRRKKKESLFRRIFEQAMCCAKRGEDK